MAQDNELWISPLFQALTRPPMIFGVTLDFASYSFLLTLCVWLLSGNFIYLSMYLPLHVIGWVACKFDPNILQVWTKSTLILPSKNKALWGCDSYEPW